MPLENETLIELTADIVGAHVSNNEIGTTDVPALIQTIYAALQGLGKPTEVVPEKPIGAVTARASIKPSHIISMIDGKPYKMLKRHLSLNGYTPETYREAFNLPRDYPMIAADYSEKRRGIAQQIGLGRRSTAEAEPARQPSAAAAPNADM